MFQIACRVQAHRRAGMEVRADFFYDFADQRCAEKKTAVFFREACLIVKNQTEIGQQRLLRDIFVE